MYDVAKLLPHYAGDLVAAEVEVLAKLTTDTARPYAVVLGGSKVSDKLGVIEALAPKVDTLVIGGGMAFTFLAAKVCRWVSRCCRKIRSRPARLCWSGSATSSTSRSTWWWPTSSPPMPSRRSCRLPRSPTAGWVSTSGPKSVKRFAAVLARRRPCSGTARQGVFEFEKFAAGTKGVAEAIIGATEGGAFSRGRRRRQCRGRTHTGSSRGWFLSHLHRWRSLSRVPRGQRTSRTEGIGELRWPPVNR